MDQRRTEGQARACDEAMDLAMDRYASGDESGLSELYDLLAPRLAAYLRKHMSCQEKVEDVVQQTFLNIVRARGSFIRGAKVLPWALRIASHLKIDGMRRESREQPLEGLTDAVDGGAPVEQVSRDPAPDELLQARQTGEVLLKGLADLSEKERVAFELVRQEGLSLADTACALGTTVTAVKLRLHRAMKSLKKALEAPPGKKMGAHQ